MPPIAAPDELVLPIGAAAPMLDGNEIVEMTIRPSPWFIFLVSLRVLSIAALVAGAIAVGAQGSWNSTSTSAAYAAVSLGVARLAWASLQWASTVYVLTNRRALLFRGVLAVDVRDVALARVSDIKLLLSSLQRATRTGTVTLRNADDPAPLAWEHLARPTDVYQALVRAVRRVQSGPQSGC